MGNAIYTNNSLKNVSTIRLDTQYATGHHYFPAFAKKHYRIACLSNIITIPWSHTPGLKRKFATTQFRVYSQTSKC